MRQSSKLSKRLVWLSTAEKEVVISDTQVDQEKWVVAVKVDLKGMGTNTNFESEVLLHPDNRFKVAAVAFQSLGTTGSSGNKKTKVRTDVYMVPTNHKYVSVKTNTQGLKTYTYRRPDGSTYTIQTA